MRRLRRFRRIFRFMYRKGYSYSCCFRLSWRCSRGLL